MWYVAMTVMMVVVMVVLITSLVPNAQLPVKLSSSKRTVCIETPTTDPRGCKV